MFDEILRFRGKKFKQNLPKNGSKSAKMATILYQFSKMFRGSMLPDPPRAFFVLNRPIALFEIILQKKTLENMENLGAPSLKKFLEFVTNIKTFQIAFNAFFGSNVFVFNETLNLIQNFIASLLKFCGFAPECGIKFLLEPLPLKFAGCAPKLHHQQKVCWCLIPYWARIGGKHGFMNRRLCRGSGG